MYDPHYDGGHSKSMAEHYDRLEEERVKHDSFERRERAKELEDNLDRHRLYETSNFLRELNLREVSDRMLIKELRGR